MRTLIAWLILSTAALAQCQICPKCGKCHKHGTVSYNTGSAVGSYAGFRDNYWPIRPDPRAMQWAQREAELIARRGRVGHPSGAYGAGGTGTGMSSSYGRVGTCTPAPGDGVVIGYGIAKGRNGWYGCRVFSGNRTRVRSR